MSWGHLPKPPRGAGHGGPAQGAGWGGEATGAKPPRPAFLPGVENIIPAGTKLTEDQKRRRRLSQAEREDRARELEDKMLDLARGAEREDTQLAAAKALHAIYEGLPVARQVNLTRSEYEAMTDDELAREQARVDAALAGDQAGASEAPGTD